MGVYEFPQLDQTIEVYLDCWDGWTSAFSSGEAAHSRWWAGLHSLVLSAVSSVQLRQPE